MPQRGETAAYRPLPRDFDQVFVATGWNGAKTRYRTHTRVIARFLNQAGRDRLLAARAEYVGRYGRKPHPLNFEAARSIICPPAVSTHHVTPYQYSFFDDEPVRPPPAPKRPADTFAKRIVEFTEINPQRPTAEHWAAIVRVAKKMMVAA